MKSDSCPELSDEGFSNAAERNQPFVKHCVSAEPRCCESGPSGFNVSKHEAKT